MSLVRFELEGTPDEVIAHLEQLMSSGRYYVKVAREPDGPDTEGEDELVTKASDFDDLVEAAEARERTAAAQADKDRS